ncbi:MAG: ATP-binding protein [Chloroflexi bacterium]|nr:ATP-binding protein [Chloroflexota bacterium]
MRSIARSFLRRVRLVVHSVRFRLTLWTLAILALVLAAFSGFVYYRQMQDVEYETRVRLEDRVRQFGLLFRIVGTGFLEQGNSILPILNQNGVSVLQPGEALALIDPNGHAVQQAGPLSSADIQQLTARISQAGSSVTLALDQNSVSLDLPTAKNGNYMFVIAPLRADEGGIWLLALGSPVDPGGQLQRLALTLLGGSLAILLAAALVGYWLAGRVMRPVHIITQAAREISETDLKRRLNLNTQDELGELANTFDKMLGRLQAAFDRQRQFTADASHELRTPLTIIDLEAERALTRRRSPEEYERALGVIQSENGYMSRLVNDLLTLARMDAGQTVLKHEEVDLSDLALEVVERLAPLARRRGVEIVARELPEVVVQVDRQYIVQLISNLVENAIKYAGGAGRHVWVDTGIKGEGKNQQAWIQVADDGVGIPSEHIPHLFDRFYQVDKARSRMNEEAQNDGADSGEAGGSGLGLAIVQWIAQAHGGVVTVSSEVGQGTTFEVALPMATKFTQVTRPA